MKQLLNIRLRSGKSIEVCKYEKGIWNYRVRVLTPSGREFQSHSMASKTDVKKFIDEQKAHENG